MRTLVITQAAKFNNWWKTEWHTGRLL
jgi:hypothetical protein